MEDLVRQRREELAPNDPIGRREFLEREDPRSTLAGLALSGGGIRSATFALGVLQALGERRLLWIFDYLSTVSGGGYVGGWWSAWLSRAERVPDDGIFPDDERLEPDRFPATLLDEHNVPSAPPKNLPQGTPDASRSAWLRDPIHHLRLFSNYLTPRKGALSADTWRAVTVVSRNLLLTWAALLPLLLAVVVMAQLYFAADPSTGPGFACSHPGAEAPVSPACDTVLAGPPALPDHSEVVRQRVTALLQPFLAVGLVIGALILLWMLYGGGNPLLALLGFATVAGGLILLFRDPAGAPGLERLLWTGRSGWFRAGELGAALALLAGGLGPPLAAGFENLRRELAAGRPLRPGEKTRVARDRVRNQVARWHARLLVGSAVTLLVLLVAGFGHELVWFLFAPETGAVGGAARKAGGWGAVALTVGSALFTLLRAGPSAKGKDAAAEAPKLPTRLIVGIAPPLLLAALAVGAATLGQRLYTTRAPGGRLALAGMAEVWAALIGIALVALYALYERWSADGGERGLPRESRERQLGIIGVSLAGLLLPYGLAELASGPMIRSPLGLAIVLAIAVGLLRFRFATTRPEGTWASLMTRAYAGSAERQRDRARLADVEAALATATDPAARKGLLDERRALLLRPRKLVVRVFLGSVLSGSLIGGGIYLLLTPASAGLGDGMVPALAEAGLGFAGLFLALDLLLARRDSDRSIWLAGLVALACGALLALHYQPRDTAVTGFLALGTSLGIFLVAAVIGLGWTTDPNLVALHNFYKARLVRAFLGASNTARKHADISEIAVGDDLPLKDLKNHLRGAPIQIVNTTLNLVGGRDLATAQRFAAPFTMSSEICGSARTGYHRTRNYMDGTLSLGTAVAASGAAVSTNMGSKTIGSALSLLLALFNVRLGIWAPTPNRERWYERRARLWPFYLLREALSQTDDLGPYCYLTDGGHFDNTGLYALVERGCRYIMVLDDGADPLPCFSDMGDAIRRCRIDFGAEIDFGAAVDQFLRAKDGKLAKVHHARGTIQYAESHLRMLGWSDDEIRDRSEGIVVWVKPLVTAKDSVDIRQYKLENPVFPQQTTADQWYDESQFESYRALGYQSAMAALRGVDPEKIRGLEDVPVVFGSL